MSTFKQADHDLLVIPGPIECSDPVLASNASPSVSHVSPTFSKIFQSALTQLLSLLSASEEKGAQPIVVAGSGTLGWDMVAANLVERGDRVLVCNSGYFGDSFRDCLEVYGAEVTTLQAPALGRAVTPQQLHDHLKEFPQGFYKLMTLTHVDTSTGVLCPAHQLFSVLHAHSPGAFAILDGTCSVGSEEILFDAWGVDVVLTASQKGLGCPPGLSVVVASKRAVQYALEGRKTPVGAYYVDWKRWVPVMRAYQAGGAAYFATPPTNLITALNTSLSAILSSSLLSRWSAHTTASQIIKSAVSSLGLKQLAPEPSEQANGMTAVWAPEGVEASQVVKGMLDRGVVVAAGLHKDCKAKYFRIGHMGITATEKQRGDVEKAAEALRESLEAVGWTVAISSA